MTPTDADLEIAQIHVRDGERHVARQREILHELGEHGHPTEQAESILVIFEEQLELHRDHLARMRAHR